MNGVKQVTTMPKEGEKIKTAPQETTKPRKASIRMAMASVVKPLTELISSVMMLVSTPGARSLLSNQPMCFLKMDSKSMILSFRVKLSPPKPKQSFCVKELRPIPRTRPIKAQVHKSLC